jgi:hypothetical protein
LVLELSSRCGETSGVGAQHKKDGGFEEVFVKFSTTRRPSWLMERFVCL